MIAAAAGVEVGRVANFLFCGFLSLIISDNPTKSQAVVFCNRRLSFFFMVGLSTELRFLWSSSVCNDQKTDLQSRF